MPGGRDSTIVKLEFSSGVSVPPPQAFTVLKNNGVEIGEIEMLQAVTVLYLPFEVDQRLVARVLSQYGTVSEMRWCKYTVGDLKGIFNGKRQFRMELVRDIPSFLSIGVPRPTLGTFASPVPVLDVERRGTKPSRVPTDVVENVCSWGTARQSVPTRYGATSVGRRDMCLVPAFLSASKRHIQTKKLKPDRTGT
ncbi:hypothetical protein HOLleu_03325 [Holothuria leucospilota]|uniref:Uncharacterized protein n=1 Tax=Holothuria leucospilota TaxID=206669 RepID=A0A9Q1CSQ1_HOLLE|nr:hypothetical protein HOLleu_03325 [Holothuria leucospilota]